MKQVASILFFFAVSMSAMCQIVTKNDLVIMGIEVGSGYMQGWREEVLYHPNELFRHFPKLSRTFWDNRVTWKQPGKFDANHVLKGGIILSQLVAISVKASDLGKRSFKKIFLDILKYYASYQLGFFLSYNLTHNNKL